MNRAQKVSWLEWFAAALVLLVGVGLGLVWLLVKPVSVVETPPTKDQQAPGMVYFAEGSHDRAKAGQWVSKRSALLAARSGMVMLSEDELNEWFSMSTHTRLAMRGTTSSTRRSDAGEWVNVGMPNFRIGDQVLQIAAPATVDLVITRKVVIAQVRGKFVQRTGLEMFHPTEVWAGSLPLHRIPGAVDAMQAYFWKRQALPAEAEEALQKIQRVSVLGRQLAVEIR